MSGLDKEDFMKLSKEELFGLLQQSFRSIEILLGELSVQAPQRSEVGESDA